MRICLVSSSFYPAVFYGGPISSTWDLSKKLGEQGVEIYVSTTNANGKTRLLNVATKKHTNISKNVWIRYYHEQFINLFSLSFIFNIWKDVKKSDIVYIQYLFHYTVPFALLFSWFFDKDVVLCPRGSLAKWGMEYKRKNLKKIWLFLFIYPFKKYIKWQASSYIERDDILQYFPSGKVVIVTDGIEFSAFQTSTTISKEALLEKYTGKQFEQISDVVFSMGRLHKIKGFDILIDAFNLYLKESPNAKLIIAGADDGMQNELEIKINNLNLTDAVFLIGMVNKQQKIELLSSSSAFALASAFESFGIVVAEALACGLPVVVSNKTPWKDIEVNNCGILAENQKDDFCRALKQLKTIKFSKDSCRKYINSHYDWNVIIRHFRHHFLTKK